MKNQFSLSESDREYKPLKGKAPFPKTGGQPKTNSMTSFESFCLLLCIEFIYHLSLYLHIYLFFNLTGPWSLYYGSWIFVFYDTSVFEDIFVFAPYMYFFDSFPFVCCLFILSYSRLFGFAFTSCSFLLYFVIII